MSNSMALRERLVQFVYDENRLLDERRFEEWFELFADDGVYWVPARVGQTDKEGEPSIALEGRLLLKLRIERLGHERAHSLRPQVRSMHVVQQPVPGEPVDGLNAVSCNMAYFEYQAGQQLVLGAQVRSLLREAEGRLSIVEKRVQLLDCDGYLPAIQLFI